MLKSLRELLQAIEPRKLTGVAGQMVVSLSQDSRQVTENSLFVAVSGEQADGHTYIEAAIQKGAVAVVTQQEPEKIVPGIAYVLVDDSKKALGLLAAAFYNHPSSRMKVVGVTGTNGKTSTVTLLYNLFLESGFKTGLIGTVENRIHKHIVPATHTTPDPVRLQELLSEMEEAGCDYVFMEVSSHAADQDRIAGVNFRGAVFTNISHDHLDYHKSFSNYIRAKKKFFDGLGKEAFALVNEDDKRSGVMVQNTGAKVYGYSLLKITDFKAKLIEVSDIGIQLEIDGINFFSALTGKFNAYNLLAVYATARLLGQTPEGILPILSNLKSAAGRLEKITAAGGRLTGIVDYAHTPDALEKVLQTLDEIRNEKGNLLVVVGCGGNRDRQKRPEMGKIAAAYGDLVIFTSDNPRNENPESIIQEMWAGVAAQDRKKVLQIPNRKEAIRTAVRLAQSNDLILIAGKGHETYQEIENKKIPFDDKQELVAAFEEAAESLN